MRVVIQRVKSASVTINDVVKCAIGKGLLILLGVDCSDTDEDVDFICRKIVAMRIFDDDDGVMNLPITSLPDAGIIVVSQFTLLASTRKGNRPSYIRAARPEIAVPLYEQFCGKLSAQLGQPVYTGTFGADMQVGLVNDGPVTIIMDSRLKENF